VGAGGAVPLTCGGVLNASVLYPEEEKERERWRLPAFLQCISWSRRSRRKGHASKAANSVHEGMPSSLAHLLIAGGSSPTPWWSICPHPFWGAF